MIRRPPRSTQSRSSAASDVYKRQSVVRDGDEFVVSGTLDMTEAAMGAESMPGLGDSFDIKIAMTFPGKVTEHNGELSGNTVTWTPVYGEVNELSLIHISLPT